MFLILNTFLYLLGGRDKRGGPILTFPNHHHSVEFTPQDYSTCIRYLLSIPRLDLHSILSSS